MLGPVVDGSFVPALPSLLLLHGQYDNSIDVMVGHNGDEGFGYPALSSDAAFDGKPSPTNNEYRSVCVQLTDRHLAFVKTLYPNAASSELNYITQDLYPAKASNDGVVPGDYDPDNSTSLVVTSYNNTQGRQALLTSDVVINCNTHYVMEAFKGRAYSYILAVPPALHGQDLYYVFYNGQSTDIYFRLINITLANIMQDYWTNFARSGNPNDQGVPFFPKWTGNLSVQGLGHDGVGPIPDPLNVTVCNRWQLGLYV
jgi:cholinesterase